MADAKKVAAGKSFMAGVLAKVPESKRAAVQALLEDPDAQEALDLVGSGTMLQADYSRMANEVKVGEEKNKTWKTQLDDWWNAKNAELNKLTVDNALLREGRTPAGEGEPEPAAAAAAAAAALRTPAVDLTGYVKKEDVERTINERVTAASQQVVPLVTVLNKLSMQHYKDFGEILDTDALVAHARATQTPLDKGAYESFAKDKLDEKAKKKHDEEIAAARKAGAEEARAAIQTTPYPIGSPNEPTTLSGMTRKDKQPDPQYGVAAAVADFNAAVAARG